MSHIDHLKEIWAAVYDPKKDVRAEVEAFFHHDYIQWINGITMNRPEYIDHVISQKRNMVIKNIEYAQFIEKEDVLFAIYYPKGQTHEGENIEAEVIAYFQFKEGKILKIHGQVRLIKGEFSDVDMES